VSDTDTAPGGQTQTESQSSLVGSLAVLVASAAWGTSGIFVKFVAAETDVSALALAFWRDITAFVVLWTSLRLFKPVWLKIERSDLRWLAALGGSLGIFHVFWNLAVFLNGVAVATVQQAAMPAIVAVVAWIVWRESLNWTKLVAIILTFVGTVFVSGLDILGQAQLTLGGLLIGLGTPVTYAAWTLFGKKARQRHNPLTTLTYAFGFGALVLLPFQFFTPQPWSVPPLAVVWFAGLILVSTILPFTLYTFALGRMPASVASILAMSEIAFVALYAVVLLGERPSAGQTLGAALVIGGVLLLSWQGWQAAEKRRQERRRRVTKLPDPNAGGDIEPIRGAG
jgi:drug/metabolite transporter (DMT)-like permease